MVETAGSFTHMLTNTAGAGDRERAFGEGEVLGRVERRIPHPDCQTAGPTPPKGDVTEAKPARTSNTSDELRTDRRKV